MKTRMVAAGGLNWRVREWGSPAATAFVFLHGFTWTGEAWQEIASALAESSYCIAVDLPGHGNTPWPPGAEGWSFDQVANALNALLQDLGPSRFKLVGYSLGGRLALRMATLSSRNIDGLVLIGASAGLESEADRRERRLADEALADALERDGIAAFVERWTLLPLFAGMRRLPHEIQAKHVAQRLAQDAKGLALSLRVLGTGSQPCLLDQLAALETPTLLVVGKEDEKFQAIAAQLQARLQQARTEIVANSGHSVPFERPEALIDLIQKFMTAERPLLSLHEKETPCPSPR